MAATPKPRPSDKLSPAEYYQHLNTKQVMKYVGASSPATIWHYVKTGKLPKPRYPSPHRPVWRLGEVIDHFDAQLEPFDAAPRSYRGDPELDQPAPTDKRQQGSSAADKIRERLGLKKKPG